MKIQKLQERKQKCDQEKLCFISLKPRTHNVRLIEHSDIGTVVVNADCIGV